MEALPGCAHAKCVAPRRAPVVVSNEPPTNNERTCLSWVCLVGEMVDRSRRREPPRAASPSASSSLMAKLCPVGPKSALFWAAREGNIETIKELRSEKGKGQLESSGKPRRRLIMWPLRRPLALSIVPTPSLALAPSLFWQEWQRTPLINAAYYGHPEVVTLLIEAKARIEHKDNNGWTALHTRPAEAARIACAYCSMPARTRSRRARIPAGRRIPLRRSSGISRGRDTQVELHKRYTTICELLVTESDKKAEAALAEYDPAD